MTHRGRFLNRFLRGLLAVCLLAPLFLGGQERQKESVTVTAVEIPVRVFDGRGFVSGLTKYDFEVYENGVKQDITGFEAISRSILPASMTLPEPVPRLPRKRSFILIFNVFAHSDQIGDAVDFFFKNVFSPGDRLVILVNDAPVEIKGLGSGEEIAARLKALLLKVMKKSGVELENAFRFMGNRAESLALALEKNPVSDYFVSDSDLATPALRFYEDYQRAWNEYRSRTLSVNLEVYESIARRIGKLDGDKWAIGFRQRPIFPRVKTSGRLAENLHIAIDSQIGSHPAYNLVQTRQQELETSLDIDNNFPGDRIREIFTQANITFHTLLMKGVATRAGFISEDLDVRDVQAQFEDTLRRISRTTGGLTVFSNDVLESLKQACAKPDQYYLIVYQPIKGLVSPENKIDVRVLRKDVDIVSLKTRTPAKAGGFSIFGFESGSHAIAFRLKGYAKSLLEGKEQGRATINVALFDDGSVKVFSKETTLDLVADTVRAGLDLPSIAPGDYFVLIDAYDVVSGEKAVFSQAIRFR